MNNPRNEKIKKQIKAQAGYDRAHFFANGGEMVRWRGLKLVQQDKKKKKNKNKCRERVEVSKWL